MKEKNKSFLFSLMALAMAAGVAGCSSTDEKVDDNPNYDPVTNTVNTQFVFSVSTSNGPGTRMSAANTQALPTNTFRGIEGANVLTYTKTNPGEHIFSATTAGKVYNLDRILGAGDISSTDQTRVVELSLDLGTNSMMFYGKAIKSGTEADKEQGRINYHVGNGGTDTYFELQRRMASTDETVFNQSKGLITAVLNDIIGTALDKDAAPSTEDGRYAFWWPSKQGATADEKAKIVWSGTTTPPDSPLYPSGSTGEGITIATKEIGGVTNTLYAGTQTWKYYGDNYSTLSTQPLAQNLGQLYHALTTIESSSEPARSGSAASIERTMLDLWTVLKKVMVKSEDEGDSSGAIATTPEEYIAQLLAARINDRLGRYFSIPTSSSGTFSFKDVGNIINSLKSYVSTSAESTYGSVNTISTFPTNLNLPAGAVQLEIGTDGKFQYKSGNVKLGGVGGEDGTDVTKIMWPSELCYFGNSPIRTSTVPKVKSGYPATVSTWVADNSTQWGDFTKNSKVVSTTRAVAMQNPINYGTAMLKTTVKYGAAKLNDNNAVLHSGESPNQIDASASAFILKGILIGGQYSKVGWDYLKTSDENTEYIIYDNAVTDGAIPAHGTKTTEDSSVDATTKPLYTLVFDNYDSSKAANAQNDVLVCLEFENRSGQDFYGQGNLIRNGGIFYLIGKLQLSAANSISWPTASTTEGATTVCHALPPYYATSSTEEPIHNAGDPMNVMRVFIQDYVTEANFKIDANSLKYAFVTVPDLQASQISLGLSVDISWSEGPKFNDITLGGTE